MNICFAVLILLLCFSGCSQRPEVVQPSSGKSNQVTETTIFFDGTVLTVKKRDGDVLEGVRITSKNSNGKIVKVDAARGKLSKNSDGSVVITLYQALIKQDSATPATVQELKITTQER